MKQGSSCRDLHTASLELRDELLNLTELCGADRGVVRRMRKKDGPGVSDEVVEHHFARGGLRFEVGYSFTEIEWHLIENTTQRFPQKQLLFGSKLPRCFAILMLRER